MRLPSWVSASAYALIAWQMASLVSLPVVLANRAPAATVEAAYCVRQADCEPDGECRPTPPRRQADGNPCRLVCASDHGVSSWFDLAAPRIDIQRFPAPTPTAAHEAGGLSIAIHRTSPPPTPPPKA